MVSELDWRFGHTPARDTVEQPADREVRSGSRRRPQVTRNLACERELCHREDQVRVAPEPSTRRWACSAATLAGKPTRKSAIATGSATRQRSTNADAASATVGNNRAATMYTYRVAEPGMRKLGQPRSA